MPIYFVTGIDTDSGKTIATGLLAKTLFDHGKSVVTYKAVQTGCSTISLDIEEHRKLMGIGLQDYDMSGQTCPYLFKKPCSPHLAAKLEKREISPDVIIDSAREIEADFDVCLCEGAGGVMVPLNGKYTSLDLIKAADWPVVLVCSSKLGSINHSFLSLEVLHANNIRLHALIYNEFPADDQQIMEDSKQVIFQKARELFPDSLLYTLTTEPVLQVNGLDKW